MKGWNAALDPRKLPGRGSRMGIVALFVAAWMASGWLTSANPNVYLFIGVPITVVFQLAVAREGIARLWAFDGGLSPRKSLAWIGALLVLVPLASFVDDLRSGAPIAHGIWYLASATGLLVAFALISARRAGSPASWLLALLAVASGSIPFALRFVLERTHAAPFSSTRFLSDAVMYFGVSFVLEEVAFRGAFDQFLAKASTGPGSEWLSALYVSFLWGLWHFPVVFAAPADCLSFAAVQVLLFHTGLGCVLSFTARAARSLVPSAFAHAILDAVRNALV